MKTKEEIFHNKLVHYNPQQFPNGMKKCFYNAMQEYSDLTNAKLVEENEFLKMRIKDLETSLKDKSPF